MADFTNIKAEIDENIIPHNNAQLITGEKLNTTLQDMVDVVNNDKADATALATETAARIATDDTKVDKVSGKGLSTNDYTDAEKAKVENVPADTNAAIAAETEARTQGDGILDAAVRSLQSQIDSVASRDSFDELYVSTLTADVIAAQNIYGNFHGNLHGNADSATNATNATYATYDAEAENIADNFSVIGQALKSLQSQIDSVASRDLAELTEAIIYLKMKVEELANS